MSRLYDDKPLSTLPVQNVQWTGEWSIEKLQCGNGVILEGVIKRRSRVVISASNKKERYFIFAIQVKQAHRRVFDAKGNEVEPNFSQTQKVRTGFLNSSYRTDEKGVTDKLAFDELSKLVNKRELDHITKCDVTSQIPFWIEESSLKNIEFEDNEDVRLKTRGDGPFIANIAKLDQQTYTASNFAGGEHVGSSWTDKVMAVKQQEMSVQQENEGVDEDEWDD